jgi:hypothetical protein
MFNVQPINSTPGFRVGLDDDQLGFNVAEPYSFYETAESPFRKFDLVANPYLRATRDRLGGLASRGTGLSPASLFGSAMAAPAVPSATQSTPLPMRFAGEGLQSPSAVDVTDLCQGVGRAGPYCLYRCSDGKMISTTQYPTGPCPPFRVRGIGTFPWGEAHEENKDYRPGGMLS